MQNRRTADPAAACVPRKTETDRVGDGAREDRRNGRFARALARSAFGRHYWDDRLEAELRWQLENSQQDLRSRTPGVVPAAPGASSKRWTERTK